MKLHADNAREVMSFLKHVDDPLRTAAAIAGEAPDAAAKLEILASAVAAFGDRVNARSLQALTRQGPAARQHRWRRCRRPVARDTNGVRAVDRGGDVGVFGPACACRRGSAQH